MKKQILKTIRTLQLRRKKIVAKKSLSLYIHIPFCKTICLYCNFLTFAHKNKWIPNYIEALQREITSKAPAFEDYQVVSIYFGGGTPSLIDSKYIESIIYSIKESFNVGSGCEINLEANPESLSTAKIQHYNMMGVNRISLGVQSLNSKTLFRLARPHDDMAVYKALENLQQQQFKNFGLDIIIGLPNQTLAEFKKQLQSLLSYHPTHFSAYFLSYDTPKIDLFIKECPSEKEQIKMYNYFIQAMGRRGFIHYEVSNYALPGYECIHNRRYWNRQEYLGLGLGAHSFYNETVMENTRDFDKYLADPLLLEDQYQLEPDVQRMDTIMLSLRQKTGLDLNNYRKKYGQKALPELLKSAQQYLESGRLQITKNFLQPTEQGFLIIDKITKDLL